MPWRVQMAVSPKREPSRGGSQMKPFLEPFHFGRGRVDLVVIPADMHAIRGIRRSGLRAIPPSRQLSTRNRQYQLRSGAALSSKMPVYLAPLEMHDGNLELATALSKGFFEKSNVILEPESGVRGDIIKTAKMLRGEDAAAHTRTLAQVIGVIGPDCPDCPPAPPANRRCARTCHVCLSIPANLYFLPASYLRRARSPYPTATSPRRAPSPTSSTSSRPTTALGGAPPPGACF
mmetsp:Transcript_33271/g.106108  ORF Transcript_33271/g.106108 Transcript_33271/m.106108 type:complete len:233 (-) Transcript_33271:410-1108(-)